MTFPLASPLLRSTDVWQGKVLIDPRQPWGERLSRAGLNYVLPLIVRHPQFRQSHFPAMTGCRLETVTFDPQATFRQALDWSIEFPSVFAGHDVLVAFARVYGRAALRPHGRLYACGATLPADRVHRHRQVMGLSRNGYAYALELFQMDLDAPFERAVQFLFVRSAFSLTPLEAA